MKAVILAAGKGERLAPYTEDRPKCMVEIGGRPLLFYTLQNLRRAKIRDINIVTGYLREKIEFEGLQYFHNQRFAATNMVESLFCAEAAMDDDLVVSYGDIVYEYGVLEKLLNDRSDIAVVVDDEWQRLWRLRSSNPLEGAETLVFGKDSYLTEIGDRPTNPNQIESQYIGLLKFSRKGIQTLKDTFHRIKSLPEESEVIRGRNKFQIYMTDILQVMIDNGEKIKGVRINGGWIEIDTRPEYELFCRMQEDGRLKVICDIERIAREEETKQGRPAS